MDDVGPGFRERVETMVRDIPRGRVMTYGQIASLCGNPRAARIVGGIAHFGDIGLPWQRVVNKQGGLAAGYPGGRSGHRQELEAEGFTVLDERVDVQSLIWWPPSGPSDESKKSAVSLVHEKVPVNTFKIIPNLVVVVGETASGKSALAMNLAKRYNGELICADSWTVRRELNIGTAKPTHDELTEVRHHLLDVVGPDEDFTAAVFKLMATVAIKEIARRGKLPIMVGGTGLYIDGVLFDYGFLPEGDRAARKQLSALSNDALLAQIASKGIELGDVDVRNKRRLIRLLETNGARATHSDIRANTLIIGLQPERTELEQRIANRVDGMLSAGLEVEVRGLVKRYGWNIEGLKGVGYAQWQRFLEGDESITDVRQKIIKATTDLAKRQRTWFRRNKSIQWISTPVKYDTVDDLITTFLSRTE
jgi:tRNA dimethylallyltransferase